jgi:hypothetical protein
LIPEGATLVSLPKTARLESDCLVYERVVQQNGRQLIVEQSMTSRCERISVAAYESYRRYGDSLSRLYKEEVCLRSARSAK